MEDPDPEYDYFNYELILYRADDQYYKVVQKQDETYALESEADYVVIASGDADSDSIRNLGTIDPTLYGSGMYRLVLAIICNCGGHHYKAVDERIIEIRNDARPGALDLSFTDLQVDIGGIPISLVRSYSSTDVDLSSSDFGPGWLLGFLNAGIQVAHFDKATNSLREPMARGTRILVTLPDGTVQRFTFDPKLVSGNQYLPSFRPDSDVSSTLEIFGLDDSLRLLPLREQEDGTYQGPYVTANTNKDFIPYLFGSAFVLRTQSGLEYVYDMQTGELTAIKDDTGRSIDISSTVDGTKLTTTIAASSGGQSITIERDPKEGPITKITDPNGKDLAYTWTFANSG